MEQLKVFHRASYKFTPRDKATRMFYLERTMEDIMSKSSTLLIIDASGSGSVLID
jgi:dual specificity phosphatase 12